MHADQATGARPFYLADDEYGLGRAVGRTTVNAARSCMLMPLLVRLTDSEVQLIDGALSQTSKCIEDRRGVLEEVGSSRLSIDEQALLPDLHIDPIHRDI